MKNEINVELPKWPQMIVSGEPISTEQALEIIRRTDTFFIWGGGNNREWVSWVKQVTRWPNPMDDEFHIDGAFQYHDFSEAREAWCNLWQYVRCEYIRNDWISSSFIRGPHGWCHPDGNIGFCYNVGKWPSVSEIYEDWKLIAQAFTFLNLTITLMNREECEDQVQPVVHMVVKSGQVQIHEHTTEDQMIRLHGGKERLKSAFDLYPCRGESAIDINIIKSWADKVFDKREEVFNG